MKTLSPDGTWDRSDPVREEPLFARAPPPPRAILASHYADTLRACAAGALVRMPALKRLSGRRIATDHRVALLPPRDPTRPLHNVLILGSGRSGTSMVAGLFRDSGYYLGFDLLAASAANPYGYFEDTGITEINNLLLRWMLGWGRQPHLPGLSPAARRISRASW